MRTAPLRRSSCRVGGAFVILGCVGAALWLWSLVGLGGSHDSLPMGAVIAVTDVGTLVWYALWSFVIARTEREVVS